MSQESFHEIRPIGTSGDQAGQTTACRGQGGARGDGNSRPRKHLRRCRECRAGRHDVISEHYRCPSCKVTCSCYAPLADRETFLREFGSLNLRQPGRVGHGWPGCQGTGRCGEATGIAQTSGGARSETAHVIPVTLPRGGCRVRHIEQQHRYPRWHGSHDRLGEQAAQRPPEPVPSPILEAYDQLPQYAAVFTKRHRWRQSRRSRIRPGAHGFQTLNKANARRAHAIAQVWTIAAAPGTSGGQHEISERLHQPGQWSALEHGRVDHDLLWLGGILPVDFSDEFLDFGIVHLLTAERAPAWDVEKNLSATC